MPGILRIELILFALWFLWFVVSQVNRRKLQMQFSVVWLLIAAGMIVVSIFPGIISFIGSLCGIETSSNLVYFVGIICLLLMLFGLTKKVSKQAEQIKRLTQIQAIEAFLKEQPNTQQE